MIVVGEVTLGGTIEPVHNAVSLAEILDKRARDVSDQQLDKVLGAGYGIFAGEPCDARRLLTVRASADGSRAREHAIFQAQLLPIAWACGVQA